MIQSELVITNRTISTPNASALLARALLHGPIGLIALDPRAPENQERC